VVVVDDDAEGQSGGLGQGSLCELARRAKAAAAADPTVENLEAYGRMILDRWASLHDPAAEAIVPLLRERRR
jgi:hypothetical protein